MKKKSKKRNLLWEEMQRRLKDPNEPEELAKILSEDKERLLDRAKISYREYLYAFRVGELNKEMFTSEQDVLDDRVGYYFNSSIENIDAKYHFRDEQQLEQELLELVQSEQNEL